MTDKPATKLELVPPEAEPTISPETEAALDADEKEFAGMRTDLPGVRGAAAEGIVAISVAKIPPKHEFYRAHPEFRPTVKLVNIEQGMEKQYFAVAISMEQPLHGIGMALSEHTLYLTITSRGALTIVPVNCAAENDYARTKEIGLLDAVKQWVRLYTDQENRAYRVFPAPAGRFADPVWPDLRPAKIFRLAFRDKGRLIDSTDHPMFKKWAARDQ
jgi:hypothetical protein